MNNTFFEGQLYNIAQNVSPAALSNNHKPLYYYRAKYITSHIHPNGVTEHEFSDTNKQLFFDDDFVNTNLCQDNSLIIVLSKL